jgi:hypothetical protein
VIETGGAVKKIKQGHYFSLSLSRTLGGWYRTGRKFVRRAPNCGSGAINRSLCLRRDKRRRRTITKYFGGWATNLNLQAIFGQFHSARVHLGLSYRWRSGCFAFSAHLFQQAAGGRSAAHKCNWLCAYSGGVAHVGSVGGCARVHWRASLPRSFDAAPSRITPAAARLQPQTFKTSFSALFLSLVTVSS